VYRLLINVDVQNGSARTYLLTFHNIVTVAGLFRIAGISDPDSRLPADGSAGNRPIGGSVKPQSLAFSSTASLRFIFLPAK